MLLDLPPVAERSGRAASAALPPRVRSPNRLACDVCGAARSRDERQRLVWEKDPETRLVLAELCRDCATLADSLLELYGGRGREAIRLVEEIRASTRPRRVHPRVLRYPAHGVLYLLIAFAAFLLVTVVTSFGR